ncbi:hypothetical protein [Flavobacterium sp.]|uniref:hypothetical protein n=1 Tax=Flavobacterium sp. TaxID=239 RepID=UPI0025C41946|nr:hypothetical protein [Flavobacterium sp.]MBA4155068.1 hypothetical protein [Flavobacterium sp.]
MLQERIKQTVDSLNAPEPAPKLFHYAYGKDHWQNLADHQNDDNKLFEERNKYFKLLWVDDTHKMNEFSAVENIVYDAELLILATSNFSDPSYEYKYETHIKKLKQLAAEFYIKILDCSDWKITAWKVIEIENIYDNNLDGLKIKMTCSHKHE